MSLPGGPVLARGQVAFWPWKNALYITTGDVDPLVLVVFCTAGKVGHAMKRGVTGRETTIYGLTGVFLYVETS
jgi:hypothetical protein